MVSIIVPVYNVENYLKVCVDSILNQTYENYELILIDDGSTDTSGIICDSYANSFDKVRSFHQKNSGVSASRNLGIEKANGEYITFIDSDDWVEPDYIGRMVAYMEPGAFVAGHLVLNNKSSIKSDVITRVTVGEAQISVFSSKGIGGFAVAKMFDLNVVRKNHIKYCEDIAICEDELFSIMYLSNATTSLTILEYAGYHYRVCSEGATLGRYGHKPPRQKDFTEIIALERAEQYLMQNKEVQNAWKQRRDKAAVATLRTMISCDYKEEKEIVRLKKMIRKGCIRYILGDIGSISGKMSMLLCTISPKLEWEIYKKQHTKR